MYNLVICDDNLAAVRNIKASVEALFPDKFDIRTAQSFKEIDTDLRIDILLMDIELNDNSINGIGASMELLKNQGNIQVIFISSYYQYAQEIFNVKPVYYVQKPVDDDVLKKAIDRALDNLEESTTKFFSIKVAGELLTIPSNEILFFESQLRKVKLITASREVEFYDKLMNVESKMSSIGCCFIRSHKSFLINASHITSITADGVVMDNGRNLPVSKANYAGVKMEYLKYITDRNL